MRQSFAPVTIERAASAWAQRASITLFCVFHALFTHAVYAQSGTVKVSLESKSFFLQSVTNLTEEGGRIVIYFSSYDGKPGIQDDVHPGFHGLSGEIKPIAGLHYRADYAIYQGTTKSGVFSIDLPWRDNNVDGIHDVAQYTESYSSTASGRIQQELPIFQPPVTFTASVRRGSASHTGNIDIILQGQDGTFSGEFYVPRATGTAAYDRETKLLSFDLAWPDLSKDFSPRSGPSRYTPAGHDLNLGAFVLKGPGYSVEAFASSLKRSGNSYAGQVTLRDGNTTTLWPDFEDWTLRLTDVPDHDDDGLPDLSEVRSLVLDKTLADLAVAEGGPLTLEVSAIGEPPITYRWFKNNTIIPSATNSFLRIPTVTPLDAGAYRVEIADALSKQISSARVEVSCAVAVEGAPREVSGSASVHALQIVASAGCPWQLTQLPDWVAMSVTGGHGPRAVEMTIMENPERTAREAILNLAGLEVLLRQGPKPVRLVGPTAFRGGFQFSVAGLPGERFVFETSEDLKNWAPLSTNTVAADATGSYATIQPASMRLFLRARME